MRAKRHCSGAPASGGGCATTNAGGPTTAAPGPTNRVMLTWDTVNGVGIPFEWSNFNSAQQAALDFGDSDEHRLSTQLSARRHAATRSIPPERVCTAPAIPSSATSSIRARPGWDRPPRRTRQRGRIACTRRRQCRRTAALRLICSSPRPNRARLNVVYVGSNDGFLHGFRAGSFDAGRQFRHRRRDPE